MPRKYYKPEEIIKLLRLVEIEVGKGQTTGKACMRIPEEACHPFHAKAATHSTRKLPPIPEQVCHPVEQD